MSDPFTRTAYCTAVRMEYVGDEYGNVYPSGDYLYEFADDPKLVTRRDEPDAYKVGTEYTVTLERREATTTYTALIEVGEEATDE